MKSEDRYDSLIRYYAEQKGLDWLLLKSQIKQESNFDPDAKSKAGAVGLAQFMPLTWQEWNDGTPGIQADIDLRKKLIDARDPEDCIKAQAAYMDWLSDYLDKINPVYGITSFVLAAYNWGIGKVVILLKSVKLLGELDTICERMPAETQTYIKNILKYYSEYRNAYPNKN